MVRRTVGVAVGLALALAAPAVADTGSSVTATGTASVRVTPKDRHSNASIKAAVEAAQNAGIPLAIADAKEYAAKYAAAARLTLGPIVAVSDEVSNGYFGPGQFIGPFGPEQYCGTIRQPVFKLLKNHRRKLVRFKKVHRCFVPFQEITTLAVTYSAT